MKLATRNKAAYLKAFTFVTLFTAGCAIAMQNLVIPKDANEMLKQVDAETKKEFIERSKLMDKFLSEQEEKRLESIAEKSGIKK
jgi:glutamate mutase epsilon subunit